MSPKDRVVGKFMADKWGGDPNPNHWNKSWDDPPSISLQVEVEIKAKPTIQGVFIPYKVGPYQPCYKGKITPLIGVKQPQWNPFILSHKKGAPCHSIYNDRCLGPPCIKHED